MRRGEQGSGYGACATQEAWSLKGSCVLGSSVTKLTRTLGSPEPNAKLDLGPMTADEGKAMRAFGPPGNRSRSVLRRRLQLEYVEAPRSAIDVETVVDDIAAIAIVKLVSYQIG